MRTRQLALLVGVSVATIAAVVALTRPEPVPSGDLHEHFRVALEVPPVDAALWFATRYPEYFTSGEAELGPWLAGLPAHEREFVLALAQTLTWAWVEHELAGVATREPNGLAAAATAAVRHATLNQLEINVDHFPEVADLEFNAYIAAPEFGAGVFARLVRGTSNCEGQNHLIALLLDAGLNPAVPGLPKIRADMAGIAIGHEVVRLDGVRVGAPVFVDGWSNLPAFTLDPARPGLAPALAELGEAPPPVVPALAGRAPVAVELYAEARTHAVELLPARDAPTTPVDLDIRAPALDRAGLAEIDDPWQLYLYARILHIYSDPRARSMYRLLLDRECGDPPKRTYLCTASTLLLERLIAATRDPAAERARAEAEAAARLRERERTWATAELRERAHLVAGEPPFSRLILDRERERVAGVDGAGQAALWRLVNGERVELPTPGATIVALGFTADGMRLTSVDSRDRWQQWHARSGEPLELIDAPPRVAAAELVGLSGGLGDEPLALAERRGQVTIVDARAQALTSLPVPSQGPLALAPDGRQLVSAGLAGEVLIWDLAEQAVSARLDVGPEPIRALSFAADGAWLLLGSDVDVQLWSVARRERIATLLERSARLLDVGFSPDERRVYAAYADGRVLLVSAE